MAKRKIIICDICGKQFSPYKNERAKLKIRFEDCVNFDDWEFNKWKKFDVCPSCAGHLVSEVRKMVEESDTDG